MRVPIVERWVVMLAIAVLSASQARAQPGGHASRSAPRHAFQGVTYENPGGWEEKQQADTRVLVAPNARAGELLVVILSASSKVIKGPAADLEALARAAELHVAKATHGPADSQQAGDVTITTMTSMIEDPSLGKHSRIYELVSDGTHEAFIAVISRGTAT